MPSKNFYAILDAIEDTGGRPSWAIEGFYDQDEESRTFLAYLLGGNNKTNNGEEVVLAYQFKGPHTQDPHPSPGNWRCFKVGLFVAEQNPNGPVTDPELTVKLVPFDSDIVPPNPLTNGQVDKQNCVLGGVPGQPF